MGIGEEIWKDIPSVPGLQASSHGRVRVEPYESPMPYGGVRTYGGHETKGIWAEGRYGYRYRRRNYKVARLVCEAFHGAPPIGRPYCLYADENARNNNADNLSWGTQKENLNVPGFVAYCKSRTGDNSPVRKGAQRKAGA